MSVSDEVRAFLSAAGKKGGASKSLAKQASSRRNLRLRKKVAAVDAAPAQSQPAPQQPAPAVELLQRGTVPQNIPAVLISPRGH